MTSRRTFVIVGASLAGAKAAEGIRAEGFDGRVVLVGEEPFRPYERPPLSKDYLRGEAAPDTAYVHPEAFYGDHRIELRLSQRAESIDPAGATVTLAGGERLRYDRLLLATGAAPRPLTVPGADLEGVHYLRTLQDADRLSQAIRHAGPVVVIGAGWIGCEVAASARQMGADVAMVDVASVPLERALGPQLGDFYRKVHADHGVQLHLGTGITELRGAGSVSEVVLTDGTRLQAGAVVVGVGVTPRVEQAAAAGLKVDNGVVTDEHLATSAPGVYAAGDAARAWHPVLGRYVRLEHWSSALNQGPVAGRNMAGASVVYEKIPYFFSDQYDVGMEYSGLADSGDRLVLRGDPATGAFIAFWMREGRVTAGMNVNTWDVSGAIAHLVATRTPVDPDTLADPGTDLAGLAGM